MFVLLYNKIFKKENIKKIYFYKKISDPHKKVNDIYSIRIDLFEGQSEELINCVLGHELEKEMKRISKKLK